MELDTDPALIQNIIDSDKDLFYDQADLDVKEQICIDGLRRFCKKLTDELSEIYTNIDFDYEFFEGVLDDYFTQMKERTRDDVYKPLTRRLCGNLAVCNVNFLYTITRKCNLGHEHQVTRYYIYSLAKLMEIMAISKFPEFDHKQFIHKYFPNFFDDESGKLA